MQCPGETFCCRPGTTCHRDATGAAACLDSSGTTIAPPAPVGTPTQANPKNNVTTGRISGTVSGVTGTGTTAPSSTGANNNNNNPLDNINPFKKSTALPQVAVASGSIVTVAFLSAFLVSSLTFSH